MEPSTFFLSQPGAYFPKPHLNLKQSTFFDPSVFKLNLHRIIVVVMRKEIFHKNWSSISDQRIIDLFDEHLGNFNGPALDGTRVEVLPGREIVQALRSLNSATLELLENRTTSTVYRIKQTGFVYHVCQPKGLVLDYEDYFEYQAAAPMDDLVTLYSPKEAKFVMVPENGKWFLKHVQEPKFIARYSAKEGISNFVWLSEEVKDPIALTKLLRKAGQFINQYFTHSLKTQSS